MRTNLSPIGMLIILFSFPDQTTAQRDVCPPWFIPDNTSITGCSCHQDVSKVYCGPDLPLFYFGFCMSYSNKTGATEYGPHPYIGCYNTTTYIDGTFYIQFRSHVSLLNEFMCGPLNREGELCLAMEAISQTLCSIQKEVGLHSINSQCFHNISTSLFLKSLICILHTVLHLSCFS